MSGRGTPLASDSWYGEFKPVFAIPTHSSSKQQKHGLHVYFKKDPFLHRLVTQTETTHHTVDGLSV
jgi:hypothetical protein